MRLRVCVQVWGCARVCTCVEECVGVGCVCRCEGVCKCGGGSVRKVLEVGPRRQEEGGSGKEESGRKASSFYKRLQNVLLHAAQNQQSLGPDVSRVAGCMAQCASGLPDAPHYSPYLTRSGSQLTPGTADPQCRPSGDREQAH